MPSHMSAPRHSMIECAGMLIGHYSVQSCSLIYMPLWFREWANILSEPEVSFCCKSREVREVGNGNLVQKSCPSGCVNGWWVSFYTYPSPWFSIPRMTPAIGVQTWRILRDTPTFRYPHLQWRIAWTPMSRAYFFRSPWHHRYLQILCTRR